MVHAAMNCSDELTHYRIEEASNDRGKKKERKEERKTALLMRRSEQEVKKAQRL